MAPARGRSALAIACALLAAGCSHQVRPDESVLRIREIVGVEEGERTRAIVAEVARVDGLPPWLTLTSLAPSGAGTAIREVHGAAALEVADEVAAGATLRGAACRAAFSCADPTPPVDGGAATLGGRLEGWRLRLDRGDHPRWGEAWVVTLEGEGRSIEVLRAMAAEARLVLLGDDAAALATSTRAGGFHTSDVIPIDLWAQGARLHVAAAEEALEGGRLDDAGRLLDRAAALDARSARLHFTRARLLARRGGGAAEVVRALRPAIEEAPTLWRMEARTSEDFAALRADEAFVALTRPRALPGSNRAGEPPGRGDSTAPGAPPADETPGDEGRPGDSPPLDEAIRQDAGETAPPADEEAAPGDEAPAIEDAAPTLDGPDEEPEPIVVPPPP
ncbi:MAG TPA: hypothetical protein VN033_06635 [Vulgatibacter sp.]|nr:hypothetical protein [Vulgatibacter sp.]